MPLASAPRQPQPLSPRCPAFHQPQVALHPSGGVDEALAVRRQAEADAGMEVASRGEVSADVPDHLFRPCSDVHRKQQFPRTFVAKAVEQFAVEGENIVRRVMVAQRAYDRTAGRKQLVAAEDRVAAWRPGRYLAVHV